MFDVSQIALFLDADIIGDENVLISQISSLHEAREGDLSFCDQAKYLPELPNCRASAVLVRKQDLEAVTTTALVVADPYLSFAKISRWFDWRDTVRANVADSAQVSVSAVISNTAQLCHGVVIGENVRIGDACYVGPNSVIGDHCVLGNRSRLEANVTLYQDVKLGEDCIVHSCAVVGADGFGFAKAAIGWQKIYQLAGVRIGNQVEIGASSTIDRGALSPTLIGDGVKLDNQVHIAHNVSLGKHTAIAGCTAIAGSTDIGDNCTIAGLSGVTGHLTITSDTHITAMSLVSHSIKEPGVYSSGTGIEKHQSWKRNVVRFRNLEKIAKRLKKLENEMKNISLNQDLGKRE